MLFINVLKHLSYKRHDSLNLLKLNKLALKICSSYLYSYIIYFKNVTSYECNRDLLNANKLRSF